MGLVRFGHWNELFVDCRRLPAGNEGLLRFTAVHNLVSLFLPAFDRAACCDHFGSLPEE